ncbi:hypothetical protein D0Y65_000880 [Glycine soja]|uniref:Uncharacterized protein n=1 Tax=Glycine soja TaxID=3848 RepID=A0A445M0I2_GLYSO|nr:hypothetical protein D0Y65_000880 [Glycine soja]
MLDLHFKISYASPILLVLSSSPPKLLLLRDRICLYLQPYRDHDSSPPYLVHPQSSIVRILQDIVKLVGLYTMQHNHDCSIQIKYTEAETNPFLSTLAMPLFVASITCHGLACVTDINLQGSLIIFHLSGIVGCETDDVGFTLVDLKKLTYQNDPFIMAEQAKQTNGYTTQLPPPPLTGAASQLSSTLKQTRKTTQLRSLATRPIGAERPLVHVDPTTGKAKGPHRKKLRTYLGIVICDKDARKKAQAIQKQNTTPHVLSHGGYEYLENKLTDEKRKKKLEEAAQSGSTNTVIDPPSPIRRQVKWKMTRTKETGQMTSEAAKEIAEKIMQSQFQSQMQSQGVILPLEPEVGPSAACVSTKESCVDPSRNDSDTGDLDK